MPPKLLLIAAVIAVVWYLFKRAQNARRGGNAGQGQGQGQAGRKQAPNQSGAKEAKPIEDMIQCGACGAYFPAKSRCSCGR